jgi:hypothetical protein
MVEEEEEEEEEEEKTKNMKEWEKKMNKQNFL